VFDNYLVPLSNEMSRSKSLLPFSGSADPFYAQRAFLCSPQGLEAFKNKMRNCMIINGYINKHAWPQAQFNAYFTQYATMSKRGFILENDGTRDANEYSAWVKHSKCARRLRPRN